MTTKKLALLRYVPKPHEDHYFLRNFFETRIYELSLEKKKLEADLLLWQKEITHALKGQSRFSKESLEEAILKISNRIQGVEDNMAINRYHLYGEDIQ